MLLRTLRILEQTGNGVAAPRRWGRRVAGGSLAHP